MGLSQHRGGYTGTAEKTLFIEDDKRYFEYECVWDVEGYYIPGKMYDRNGDPGDPPEGDEEVHLISINGYSARRYLNRLRFWNPEVYDYLENYHPENVNVHDPADYDPRIP